jgi:hypothetical protein
VDDFRAFLTLNPSLRSVELSNWGEVFLHPDLPLLLATAYERGVAVTMGNGVNLNHASVDALEAIVKYGVQDITVSIDGATQAVYEVYRVRGDVERVLANVRTINELKRRHGRDKPRLTWQFVIFGHNQHEIAMARGLAEEHGMAFAPKLNWSPEYSPPRDPDAVKRDAAVTAASLDERRTSSDEEYLPACFQLWDEPQVNWDGKILGCCVNYWGELGGNAFTEPVAIWANGEAIRHARAMVTGRASAKDGIPCSTCEVFARLRETEAWIDPRHAEIRRAAREGDVKALTRALHDRLRADK